MCDWPSVLRLVEFSFQEMEKSILRDSLKLNQRSEEEKKRQREQRAREARKQAIKVRACTIVCVCVCVCVCVYARRCVKCKVQAQWSVIRLRMRSNLC